jgi:ecdysteroid kinase
MRDALATTRSVLREAAHLFLDRLGAGRDADGVPVDPQAVTPVWLSAALQASLPGVHVRAVEALDRATGTTTRARLRITYDATGAGPPPPASVFVKLAPVDTRTRLFVNLMRLGATEVRFYREIAPQMPVLVPRVFAADSAGRGQRFVLILEDLAGRGARFSDVTQRLTLQDAEAVMRMFGHLHARFWNSLSLQHELAWLKGRDHNPNYRVERCICALAVAPALRKFASVVPDVVRAAAPRIVAARDRLEVAWARGALTVIHGDAHVGNQYVVPEGVGLLDWQVVQRGQGIRDVSYFLVNSVPKDLRRAHQHHLIRRYLSTLAADGVAAPGFDEAWEQYRLHTFYAWIAAIVTAAATTLQTEPIVRTGLARSSAAIVDLESLAALDALPRR